MGYSAWSRKELDMTEQLTIALPPTPAGVYVQILLRMARMKCRPSRAPWGLRSLSVCTGSFIYLSLIWSEPPVWHIFQKRLKN